MSDRGTDHGPAAGDATIGALLARRSRASPDAIAFRIEEAPGLWVSVAWADFTAQVAALQRAMAAAGLTRGDRIAIVAPTSIVWERIHHAALGIGVAVVGFDAHDLPTRLAAMARQAGLAAVFVADPEQWARVEAAGGDAPRVPRVVVTTDAAVAAAGEVPVRRPAAWTTLAALGAGRDLPAPAAAAPDDIATIIFTSGTTGAPKCIAYTHRQLRQAVDAIGTSFDFVGVGSPMLCWLPLSNLFQRVVNLAAIERGAVSWLLSDPRRVMDEIARCEPVVFIGVPRFYEKLHQGLTDRIAAQSPAARLIATAAWGVGRRVARRRLAERRVPRSLAGLCRAADALVLRRIRAAMGTRLRCMVSGSAPLPRHLLLEFQALGWTVLEAYGLSENVLPMALNTLRDHRVGSVGRPLPDNQLRFDDEGQIHVRGPGVFTGYWGDPPGLSLDAGGYHATGDLGRLDPDGYLWLTGRNGDIIKTSTGRRIAPAGIEAALTRVPGIDQAVVVGAGRKAVVALCTLLQPVASPAERQRLQRRLHEAASHLNEHERPVAIGLLEAAFSIERGELTANLKLRRGAIEASHAGRIDALYAEADAAARAGRRETVVV